MKSVLKAVDAMVASVTADSVSLTVTLTHTTMNVTTHLHLITISFTHKCSENVLFYCWDVSLLVYKTC